MPLTRIGLSLVLVFFVITSFSPAEAATMPILGPSAPVVTYDHLNDGPAVSYAIAVEPGRPFVVNIENTFPEGYDYDIAGILLSPTPPTGHLAGGVKQTELVQKQITQVHEARFGGYVVHITHKGSPTEVALTDTSKGKKTLPDATLLISVQSLAWDYEVSGAFTVTGLTDSVFALEKRTVDGQEKQYVIRDQKAEDRDHLGIGALIHVFHTAHPMLAFTFGLGMNQGNRTTYFAGPSLRLGNKAALSFGIAAGSVSRLPSGVKVGDVTTDANLLNNLGTRIDRSWFIGFSYTFLNPGDTLQKPFAGAQTPPPAAPAPPPPPVTQPVGNQQVHNPPTTQPDLFPPPPPPPQPHQ